MNGFFHLKEVHKSTLLLNREKMLHNLQEVVESKCILHGHTCSGTFSRNFVLTASYTGCSCERRFRALRSYSPTNPSLCGAFYDIDDVHHTAAASNVAKDVAKECFEIVCNGEDVDFEYIEYICELASLAADDAMNVHATVVASATPGDAQHASAVKDAARAAAYTVSVAFAISIAKASRTGAAETFATVLHTSDDSGECTVCYRENCYDRISCGHTVCRRCVTAWVGVCTSRGNIPTCPICRRPLYT